MLILLIIRPGETPAWLDQSIPKPSSLPTQATKAIRLWCQSGKSHACSGAQATRLKAGSNTYAKQCFKRRSARRLRALEALRKHEMMEAEAGEVAAHHPHQDLVAFEAQPLDTPDLTIHELRPTAGVAREAIGGPRGRGVSRGICC